MLPSLPGVGWRAMQFATWHDDITGRNTRLHVQHHNAKRQAQRQTIDEYGGDGYDSPDGFRIMSWRPSSPTAG
jgi:hypothetical protein